jgi:hypothetical protein
VVREEPPGLASVRVDIRHRLRILRVAKDVSRQCKRDFGRIA